MNLIIVIQLNHLMSWVKLARLSSDNHVYAMYKKERKRQPVK